MNTVDTLFQSLAQVFGHYYTLFFVWFMALPPEQRFGLIALTICALFVLELGLFTYKTLLTALLRAVGLSSPNHYHRWPRVLPWRSPLKLKMALSRWVEFVFTARKRATGGFASVLSSLTEMYKPGQVFLGLAWVWGFKLYQPLGLSIRTHMLIIAQSGAGKSVMLMSMLALWQGSAFVIDPKGELWCRLGRAMSRTKQVVVLSPYHPELSGQVNPFDCLHRAFEQHGESVAIQWAARIGLAFIETPPGSKQPFFTDAARGYLIALILFVYVTFPQEQHHLGTVRDLIVRGLRVFNEDGSLETTPEEARALLHKMMLECPHFSDAIAGGAVAFINAGAETMGNLFSTLQERTKILDIPSIRYLLSGTTRPLHELKTCNDYVLFIEAPATSIRGELKDLFRLMTNLVIYTFESEPKKNGQCLIVCEELNAQGHNEALEAALPVLRSMGGSFIGVTQDVQALRAEYPKTHLAFIGNADITLWLASSHPDNLKQLHQILGKASVVETDPDTGRKTYRMVDVLTEEQIGRFLSPASGNVIATRSGKRALRLKLDPYFKALPVTAYDPDPDQRETLLRRISRWLFNRAPKSTASTHTNTNPNPTQPVRHAQQENHHDGI